MIIGFPRATLGLVLLWALAASFAIAAILGVVLFGFGSDAHAYYTAWDGQPYSKLPGELDAFLYSPAFAQAVWPLTFLPWPAFAAMVALAAAASLWWLLRPVETRYRIPLLVMCLPEVCTGNIFWLLALVALFGLRVPALWVIPALTKVLPAMGFVWFLARGEWRKLFAAVGTVACACAISFAIDPKLWTAWFEFLLSSSTADDLANSPLAPPLWLRLPAALALTAYAARRDHVAWLPVAMVLATPMFGHGALTILAAVPRLVVGNGMAAETSRTPLDAWDDARAPYRHPLGRGRRAAPNHGPTT